MSLFNDGQGVFFSLNISPDVKISIAGGPLGNETYILQLLRYHWPSEHKIDGKSYPVELQLMFYNSKSYSYVEAIKTPGAMVGLVFFYQLDPDFERTNYIFSILLGAQNPLSYSLETYRQESLNEIIGTKPFSVYSYPGSLTTPGCDETVTWMVSIDINCNCNKIVNDCDFSNNRCQTESCRSLMKS